METNKILESDGYVIVDSISSRANLLDLARSYGEIVLHPEADNEGVLTITPDPEKVIGPSGFAFSEKAIPFHTDGPGVSTYKQFQGPADLLFLWYKSAQISGGSPIISDGALVYSTLFEESPDVLLRSGSFLTQPNHMYTGPLFESGEKTKIRFKESGPDSYWDERTFDQFIGAVDKHKRVLPIRSGQVLILDNRRMLHSREKLNSEEARELHHVLVYSNPGTYSSGFRIK
ncbi:hypothetical protein HOA92_00915 [archaeon]|jgi:hypothetical protein|nr:hypothetical protein [archaeon]MBT6761579.1 hypothetical protein [archaeon]